MMKHYRLKDILWYDFDHHSVARLIDGWFLWSFSKKVAATYVELLSRAQKYMSA